MFRKNSNAGVSSPAKAAYVVETVDAELRGASNGTRWAAFAIGSCVPLRVKHPEKKKRYNLQRKSLCKMENYGNEWQWVIMSDNHTKWGEKHDIWELECESHELLWFWLS